MQKVISGILASVLAAGGVVPAAASAASPPAAQKAAVANVETIYRMEHQVLEETLALQGNMKQLVAVLKTLPASAQRRIDWVQVKIVEANAAKAIAQAKRDAALPLSLKRPKYLAAALRDDALHLRLDLAVLVASNRAVLAMTRQVEGAQQPGGAVTPQGSVGSQGTPGTSGDATPGTPPGTAGSSGTSGAAGQ